LEVVKHLVERGGKALLMLKGSVSALVACSEVFVRHGTPSHGLEENERTFRHYACPSHAVHFVNSLITSCMLLYLGMQIL
jgi:hypothetical protein